MADVNWGSVLSKATAYMNTSKMQAKVQDKVDQIMLGVAPGKIGQHTPEDAAEKFITVLKHEMDSTGLPSNVKDAISNLSYSNPSKITNNRYMIGVFFDGDLSRQSLVPDRHPDGVRDLALLYNDGVDHIMKPVTGMWHGVEVSSRTHIPGTHFMESAVDNFLRNYGSEYNTLDCKLHRD